MAIPTFQELMRPALELSQRKIQFQNAVDILSDKLQLTDEERAE